jgi:hypothetical protein
MRRDLFGFTIALLLSLSIAQAHAGESYGNLEDPVVAEVLGMQIRTKNPEEMQYVINQKLILNYAEQKNIAASQGDIDRYIAAMDQWSRNERKKDNARRAEIQQQLKTGSIPAEQTKQLQSELDTLETIHQYDIQAKKVSGQQDLETALKGTQIVAKAFIEQWLINKALYQQYGGRIIYQQSGPEPLDAIHDYLKEQQQKGAFKILEKSFEAPYWDYYVTDSKHDFYKQDSKEEKQAFGKAPWLQKQGN